MLKHREANPLAVFGLRRLEHCPPHFTRVFIDKLVSEKAITDWIYENLSGRFYFGEYYKTSTENVAYIETLVGFEIPGEASMFSLVVDTVNQPVW